MSITCRKQLSLLSIVLSVSCTGKPASQSSKTTAIIGENDLAPEQDPLLRSTIGQLKISDSICTAFVTGTNQITSAAHCLKDTQTKDLTALSFTSGAGVSAKIVKIETLDRKKDYLALTTDTSFPKVLELGSLQGNSLKLVGFDTGKGGLYAPSNCRLEERVAKSGVFSHSCDTLPGYSGAPLLQQGKVVGIHLGYQEKIDRNAAYEVAQLKDDSTDVALVGIVDECLFDCHIRNVINIPDAKQALNICGYAMQVPVVSYAACQIGVAVLPADCTVGTAATGGGACAANIGVVAAACAVSIDTVGQAAACCIKGGC